MPHKISGRRLNRTSSHRKALMRNLATSLVMHEKIKTTEACAKELRIVADELITLAKRGDLHAKRQALQVVRSDEAMRKLFDEYAKRFATRHGGYTRITKVGHRHGDNAEMSVIEYLPSEEKKSEEGGDTAKKMATKKTVAKKTATKKATTKKATTEKKTTEKAVKTTKTKKDTEKSEKKSDTTKKSATAKKSADKAETAKKEPKAKAKKVKEE